MPAYGFIVGWVEGINYVAVWTLFEVHCFLAHNLEWRSNDRRRESQYGSFDLTHLVFAPHSALTPKHKLLVVHARPVIRKPSVKFLPDNLRVISIAFPSLKTVVPIDQKFRIFFFDDSLD
jgi:hypothetical protein